MAERRLPPRPPMRAQIAGRALARYREQVRDDAAAMSDERFLTLCAASVIGADDEHCSDLGLVVAGDALYRKDVWALVEHANQLEHRHPGGFDLGCEVCQTLLARDRVANVLREER